MLTRQVRRANQIDAMTIAIARMQGQGYSKPHDLARAALEALETYQKNASDLRKLGYARD